MKRINELFAHNAEMPQEEWEELRAGFIRPFLEELVGRRLMPVRRLPAGTQTFEYDRISTEPGVATVVAKGGEYPYDEYSIRRVSFPVPKIGKAFRIPLEDFASGTILNEQTFWARRRMAEKEDDLIFNGQANLGIGGILDFVGPTGAAGTFFGGAAEAWDVATKTAVDLYDDVRGITRDLAALKVQGPYTLVMHPNRAADLGLIDTAVSRSARQMVETLVAQVLVSFALPAATVLCMRTGPEIAQLGLVEDLFVQRPRFDEDIDVWKGKARERLIPIIYQYGSVANTSDAIGTITGAGA